jgi:hypothetical protein
VEVAEVFEEVPVSIIIISIANFESCQPACLLCISFGCGVIFSIIGPTSSDLIYRVMSVWITRRANYLDLK